MVLIVSSATAVPVGLFGLVTKTTSGRTWRTWAAAGAGSTVATGRRSPTKPAVRGAAGARRACAPAAPHVRPQGRKARRILGGQVGRCRAALALPVEGAMIVCIE